MTTGQLIIVCVTVLLLALLVAEVLLRLHAAPDFEPVAERDPSAPALGSTLVLHKTDGQSVKGRLVAQDVDGFVLEGVSLIDEGREQQTAGRWHVPAVRVEAVQGL